MKKIFITAMLYLLSSISVFATTNNYNQLPAPKHKVTAYIQVDNSRLSKPVAFADDIARQGYNTIFIAFGLFDKDKKSSIMLYNPNKVNFNAFINELHSEVYADTKAKKVPIAVLLSIGGYSAPYAEGWTNDAVNYNSNVAASGSKINLNQPKTPHGYLDLSYSQNIFLNSVEGLIKKYNFDGIDIDLEHGFQAAPASTAINHFINPDIHHDVYSLAAVLLHLKQDIPKILISLAPQTTNIYPTSQRNYQYENSQYTALVDFLYNSPKPDGVKRIIDFIQIQLYNNPVVTALNGKYYPIAASGIINAGNQGAIVAGAESLMQSWNKCTDPRLCGFIDVPALFSPENVVMGFYTLRTPVGAGNKNLTAIKQAIICLRSGKCANSTYKLPYQLYGYGKDAAGVMLWSNNDNSQMLNFAKSLSKCVKENIC